jgi:hypothetical protein
MRRYSNPQEEGMKTVATTVLVAMVFLASAGCGNRERSAPADTPQPPGVSLHEAVLVGEVEAIRRHVQAGSNLDEKDSYGSTPLIVAATFGKTEAAKELIQAGADLSQTNNEGSTALHIAAFLCHTEIVKALLDGGADRNATNNAGRTALDAVAGPFEDARSVYDELGAALGPLGLKLDYEYIKATRPRIAEMLR